MSSFVDYFNNSKDDEALYSVILAANVHAGAIIPGITELPNDITFDKKASTVSVVASDPSGDDEEVLFYMGSLPKKELTNAAVFNSSKPCFIMPKYDGVSCGLVITANGLEYAHTRGRDVGNVHKNTNITERVRPLLNINMEMFNLCCSSISVRGEIVCINKSVAKIPAAYVSGRLSSGIEMYKEAMHNLRLVIYECPRVTLTEYGKEVIKDITEIDGYQVLSQYWSLILIQGIFPANITIFTEQQADFGITNLRTVYELLCKDCNEPTDGIVCCETSWKYPYTKEMTMPSKYGKVAFKQTESSTSTITEFNYSITKTGLLNIVATFVTIVINDKNYSNAKIAYSAILNMSGMGVGAVVSVDIRNGITPYISGVIKPALIPYEEIINCPSCRSVLKRTTGTNPTLKCVNPSCRSIRQYLMIAFVSGVEIAKCGEKTICALPNPSVECLLNQVSSGMVKCGKTRYHLEDLLKAISVSTFMVATSIMTKNGVTKSIPDVADVTLVDIDEDVVEEMINSYGTPINIPFAKECLYYILSI